MRLATLEHDGWQLRSALESQRNFPTTFLIPSLDKRKNLHRGHAAKLIFDIEAKEQDGSLTVGGERMWVIVAERVGEFYIGILDNEPSIEPGPETYLSFGSEIPFSPEHVIEIAEPPAAYIEWQLKQPAERSWPRD